MQHDVQPDEIDWVFCWCTSTGDIRPGARKVAMPGRPLACNPDTLRPDAGLRTIVRGREGTCPHPQRGPRLDEQGGISRMGIFVWGYVVRPHIVPARTEHELELLRCAARDAVLSGKATEWALAAIHARGQTRWGIHIAAPAAFVSDLVARVNAPWTLEVREKFVGSSTKGSQIFCMDREGRTTATLEADTLFDLAPLPGEPSPSPR